jgi:hypothetical protein
MTKLRLVRVSLLVLTLAGVSKAAEKPNVFSLPISNRLIQGEISLPGGEEVKFTSLEGSLVTVQGPEIGAFAISGEILDEATTHVRFTVFEIQDFGGGNQGLKQLDQFEVRDRTPGTSSQANFQTIVANRIDKNHKVSLEDIAAFRQATFASISGRSTAVNEPESLNLQVDGTCCVTCFGITACGCTVTLSCGSCCSDICCLGETGKRPQVQN